MEIAISFYIVVTEIYYIKLDLKVCKYCKGTYILSSEKVKS